MEKLYTWEDLHKTVERGRTVCIHLCNALFYELKSNHELCVQVLEFRRLNSDFLQYWSDTVHAYAGSEKDTNFVCVMEKHATQVVQEDVKGPARYCMQAVKMTSI